MPMDPVAAAFHRTLRSAEDRAEPLHRTPLAASDAPAQPTAPMQHVDMRKQHRAMKRREAQMKAESTAQRERITVLEGELARTSNELFEITELCVQLRGALGQYRKRTLELERALRDRGLLPPGLAMSPDMRRLLAVERELETTRKQHMRLLEAHEQSLHQRRSAAAPHPQVALESPGSQSPGSPDPAPLAAPILATTDPVPPTGPPHSAANSGERPNSLDEELTDDRDLYNHDAVLGHVRRGRLGSLERLVLDKNEVIVQLEEECSRLRTAAHQAAVEAAATRAQAASAAAAEAEALKLLDDQRDRATVAERTAASCAAAARELPQLKLRLQLVEGGPPSQRHEAGNRCEVELAQLSAAEATARSSIYMNESLIATDLCVAWASQIHYDARRSPTSFLDI